MIIVIKKDKSIINPSTKHADFNTLIRSKFPTLISWSYQEATEEIVLDVGDTYEKNLSTIAATIGGVTSVTKTVGVSQ